MRMKMFGQKNDLSDVVGGVVDYQRPYALNPLTEGRWLQVTVKPSRPHWRYPTGGAAGTGGQPAAAASAATIPNASGKTDGTTHASARASR